LAAPFNPLRGPFGPLDACAPPMPSADFCSGVRSLSAPAVASSGTPHSATPSTSRSPEVSSTAFAARPSDLLDGPRWIWASQSCARSPRSCPASNPLSVRQAAVPIGTSFRPTLAGRCTLAPRLRFTSIRLRGGLAPPGGQTCSAHTKVREVQAPPGRDRAASLEARPSRISGCGSSGRSTA
jgi:hypothetical protein